MRKKKYRDIVVERRILTFYHVGGYFAPLFPITVGYYLGVKALFGLNIYISGILAGFDPTSVIMKTSKFPPFALAQARNPVITNV